MATAMLRHRSTSWCLLLLSGVASGFVVLPIAWSSSSASSVGARRQPLRSVETEASEGGDAPELIVTSAEPPAPAAADDAAVRYAFGVNLAMKFGEVRRLFSDEEIPTIVEGMAAYLTGTVDAPDVLLRENAAAINQMLQDRTLAAIEAEKVVGAAYAAEASKRPGAKVTASGLIYEEVKEGGGPSPTAGSTVSCHYVGTLVDGTVFDSSRDRGEPAKFALKQVIAGWQEALLMMSEGGIAKLTIPSDLAYGDMGSGERIPGGATICFEVELVKVLTGGVGGLIIP